MSPPHDPSSEPSRDEGQSLSQGSVQGASHTPVQQQTPPQDKSENIAPILSAMVGVFSVIIIALDEPIFGNAIIDITVSFIFVILILLASFAVYALVTRLLGEPKLLNEEDAITLTGIGVALAFFISAAAAWLLTLDLLRKWVGAA